MYEPVQNVIMSGIIYAGAPQDTYRLARWFDYRDITSRVNCELVIMQILMVQ